MFLKSLKHSNEMAIYVIMQYCDYSFVKISGVHWLKEVPSVHKVCTNDYLLRTHSSHKYFTYIILL